MTFGTLILASIPPEQKSSQENAYAWLAAQLNSQTGGRIDIGACAIEHWVKGRRFPPGNTIGVLAKVFNWSDTQIALAVRLLSESASQPNQAAA